MAEGKTTSLQPASPAEVARTLLARAKDSPTLPEAGAAPNDRTLQSRTDSGVRARDQALTADETPRMRTRIAERATHFEIERYQPVGALGEGGMGRVDEVYDGLLGRCVAKKTLLPGTDESRAVHLIAEAQTCAQLEHPSIVPLYDIGSDERGRPFYTMRVVRGRTLRDLLAANADPTNEAVPLAKVLGILRLVCLAVDYAHSRGVVHRDLKPDNVVLGEFGEVYVVDWGIAHVREGSSVYRTSSGPVLAGTPGYMAPEQISRLDVDGRADVFSLGVMLYEVLCGTSPFAAAKPEEVFSQSSRGLDLAPSRRDPRRSIPAVFDELVLACLSPDRERRPARARAIADAIDRFLDGERTRAERQREADAYASEGDQAREAFEALDRRAADLGAHAERLLAELPLHSDVDAKLTAWKLASESQRLAADAARAQARAEIAYMRALGRVAGHRLARRRLAELYFRQFEAAEAAGDDEQMARFLDLARAYDDGALALELANQGELIVETSPRGAELTLARFEQDGPLLRLAEARAFGRSPARIERLSAGSYLLVARLDERELGYPLVIQRAKRTTLRLRLPEPGELPEGFVLIPGGPFLAHLPRSSRVEPRSLPDFAIGRFPVTAREYAEFLDALDPRERDRRAPVNGEGPFIERDASGWRLGERVVEGEGRRRVPPERQLDLPIARVNWYDASAYARWRSERDGRSYRLPTDLEWDKAMRGADGRAFPMASTLDPAFAKLRESRLEPSQPEPIGSFAHDVSPYGVRDLAGGVGDWTNTPVDPARPADASLEGQDEPDDRQVYWRGGTWSSAAAAQIDMRYPESVRWRPSWIGFRLALELEGERSSELTLEPIDARC